MVGAFSILLASLLEPTDFGIREIGKVSRAATLATPPSPMLGPANPRSAFRIDAAAQIGSRFGRVTSTLRSADRNRRVGGVPNSWHLKGRAMDVARRPGISHGSIAAELRRNGYQLLESLDEGDHSHFAFANGLISPNRRPVADQLAEIKGEADYFRFVLAPRTDRPSAIATGGRELR